MDPSALLARLALAAVLLAAAGGKLSARGGTTAVTESFGLSTAWSPAVRATPFVELLLAAGLVWAVSARPAGVATAALLVAFTFLTLRNLHQGRRSTCNCFGGLTAGRGGWWPVARNILLLGVAGLVAAAPHPVALSRVGWLATLVLVAAAGLAPLVAGTSRPRRRAAAPSSPGADRRPGEPFSPGIEGAFAVLVFVDPSCGPCRSALPVLSRWWATGRAPGLTVVTRGPIEKNADLLAFLPPSRVIFDDEGALAARHGVVGTPSAVLLDGADPSSRTVVTGAAAIDVLLRQVFDTITPPRRSRRHPLRKLPGLVDALSRREVMTAAGVGGLGLMAAACGGTKVAGSTSTTTAGSASSRSTPATTAPGGTTPPGPSGVGCPACGSCTVCEIDASNATLNCRQCSQSCSAEKLCTTYAVQNSDYTKLAESLLGGGGYTQSGDPWAVGLDQNGSLSYLSLVTELTSSSAANPKAVLVYGLANSQETAFAATVGPDGKYTNVLVVGGGVQVVAVPAPPPVNGSGATSSTGGTGTTGRGTSGAGPTGATGTAGTKAWTPGGGSVALTAASCSDSCELAANLMLLAVTLPFIGPEEAALAMGNFLIGNAFPPGSSQAAWITLLQSVLGITQLMNSLEVLKGAAVSEFCSLACGGQSWLQLKGCCNYTGACFASDAACESNCPGGLAHPGAHCDVYVRGRKVSQFVPGRL